MKSTRDKLATLKSIGVSKRRAEVQARYSTFLLWPLDSTQTLVLRFLLLPSLNTS